MEKTKVALVSDLMLASVALIWGLEFPVTQMAIDANLSSGLIVALRFLIAALVMGIIFRKEVRTITARDALLGCVAGLILGMAFLLQVMGQSMTTPSNSAFLTSLNVIIVPFLSWAFFHQRPTRKMLLVALGCLVGALVLTITPGQGLQLGFGDLPICMAKTQYSLSDNQKLLGRPEGFTIHVGEVRLSAGAGFIVVQTGDIMTMPGLPKVPAANQIDVDEDGQILGLF